MENYFQHSVSNPNSQSNNVAQKKPLLGSHILHADQVLYQHEICLPLLHWCQTEEPDMT